MSHLKTLLLGCSICLWAFCGCSNQQESASQRDTVKTDEPTVGPSIVTLEPSSSETAIEVCHARSEDMDFSVIATGQLQPNANAVTRISSPISGKVQSVNSVVGDDVRKGQVLLTISSQEIANLESDLFKSETEIDSDLSKDILEIDCDLEQADAQLAFCKQQFERAKLMREEKIGSQVAYETAKMELEKQEITIAALKQKKERIVRVANERKRLGRTALKQKLELLGMPDQIVSIILAAHKLETNIPIVTPQAGVVLERAVNVGELVDPSRVLFTVDDLDNLWLVANIFEQDVERIKVGQNLEFTVDSFPGRVFTGKLNFVAGTINPETRTLSVRAEVPNPGFKLKPKMFARMKINVGREHVLTIPKDAVQDAGSKKVVYVPLAKDKFEEIEVEVGEAANQHVQVLKGLTEGQPIVCKGAFALRAKSLKDSQ